jgi:hypothetical protein
MNAPATVELWRIRQALHQCVDLIIDALEARRPTPSPTPWPAPKGAK